MLLYIQKRMKKVFFFLLLPIYGPLAIFMNYTFEWWAKLGE